MFKKKISILACFILSIFSAFSQSNSPIKLTMSDEYENENDNRTHIQDMLRDEKGNIIIIKTVSKIFGSNATIIDCYKPDMDLIYSKQLKVEDVGGNTLNYLGAYSIGNIPYVLSSFYNKEKDFHYLLVSKIEADGHLGKPKKISECPSQSKSEGGFQVVFSKDSSKLLVVNLIPTKKKENKTISFIVLDNSLTEIWKAKAVLPYENRDVILSDYAIDNQANVFVLATIDDVGDAVLQEIFEYQQGASGSKRYKTNLNDKVINKLKILPDNDGNIVCVGQYSSTSEKNNFFRAFRTTTLGTIFFKIDPFKNEIIDKKINPFDDAVFDFFEISKSKASKGVGVPNLSLWNTWVNKDNSISMDFEQEYYVVQTRSNGYYGGYSSTTTYHSGTALTVKLDKDGNSLFETFVPKYMISNNDKTGLYHLIAHKDDKVFYVYNDHPKNLTNKIETYRDLKASVSPETSGISFGDRRPVVNCCIIDKDGKKKYAQLFSFKNDDLFLNTENYLQYDANTIIVIASYLRNFKLVKLEF